MRKHLTLLLMAGGLVASGATARAQSGTYFQAVTNLNPLGYWPLNETTYPAGKPAAANTGSLGSTDNGAYSDGAIPGAPGALKGDTDPAALFNGATGFNPNIGVPYDPAYVGVTSFTVEFWVNSPYDPGYMWVNAWGPQIAAPVSCMDTASPNAGWVVYEGMNAPGSFNFQTFKQNGTTPSLDLQMNVPAGMLDASGNLRSNTWYHVAVTFNGTTATGYVNGQQVATGTASGYVPATGTGLTLGNRSGGGNSFPGSMDEVALYPTVLSGADILAHYQAGTNAAPSTSYQALVASKNPLLYYRLDDASALVAKSYGTLGSYLDAYLDGGATPGMPGPTYSGFGANSTAFSFSGGASSVLSIPNAGALVDLGDIDGKVPTPDQPVSLASWVMVNGQVGGFLTLLGTGDSGYRFSVDPSGFPHFAVGWNGGDAVGNMAINDGQWHLWVGVWDHAAGKQLIYVDGDLAGSADSQPGGGPSGQPLLLGAAPDYSDRNFVGSLAHVALFNNVLSPAQIQSLYNAAGPVPIITLQPQPTVAMQGSNVSLTVSAKGKPTLTYQWYTGTPGGGTPVSGGNISGATTSTLSFTSVQPANANQYYVVVSDGNGIQTTSVGVSLSVLTSALAGSYFPAVIGLNPQGYWPLNETTQPPASDIATNLGTMGAAGNAAYSASGVIHQWGGSGPGLTPDGAPSLFTQNGNGEVSLPYSRALSLAAPFTAEAWLNAFDPSGTQCALSLCDANNPRSGWLIYANAGFWDFRMYNTNGTATSVDISGPAAGVAAGQWYHVVAVYDGTQASLYINGQLAASLTPTSTPGYVPNDNGALTIGARSDNGFFFNGGEADVAIYTNALSAATVQAHYQAGINNASVGTTYRDLVLQSNPLLFYRLDEPPYTAPDPSSDPIAHNYGALGANDNGYYTPGCFPASVPGPQVGGFPSGTACRFNSAYAGYVNVPVDANNGLNLLGPVTMTAWVQGSPADNRFQSMAGRGDTSYRFGLEGNGNVHFADGNNGNPDVVGGFINDGRWHFLAGVWDGSAELIYIDGVLSASVTDSSGVPGNNGDFVIGGVPDYLPGRIFNGNMTQVAVFGKALSAAQVQGLYNAAGVRPYIVAQPAANSIFTINTTNTLSVSVGGTAPVSYQWYKNNATLSNGGDISGATTASLTIGPAALADAGSYQLVAANSYGSVTSVVATVSVVSGPIISPDLAATNEVFIGTTATLSVGLSGTGPFTNMWTLNGQPLQDGGRISGAHTPTLVIANAQPGDAGSYQFWSANSLGTSHSSPGQLVVDTVLGFNLNGAGWTANKGSGSGSSAAFVGNNLIQLTTAGAGSQHNSFFFGVPQYVGAFKAHFTYYDLNGGADGACFVLQNSPQGARAVGDAGGGMGVRGITKSFEVEIDLYNNGFAVDTNGLTHESTAQWAAGNPEFQILGTADEVNAAGQTKDMTLAYDGNTLSMTWSNETSHLTGTTNIVVGDIKTAVGGSTAYVGFTGACGGVDATQIVGNFSYVPLAPMLTIAPDGTGGVVLSWPAVSTYTLQRNSSLTNPAGWTTVAGPYTTISGASSDLYQVHVTQATGSQFYRVVITP